MRKTDHTNSVYDLAEAQYILLEMDGSGAIAIAQRKGSRYDV